MNQNFIAILEQFYRITNRISKMRNTQLRLNGAKPLNTAAIHMIDVIGKHKDVNLTEIANILGITKGAVSQMTGKLERDQLIQKKKFIENDKDVHFVLTEEGWNVYTGHESLHNALYEKLDAILSQFEQGDIEKMIAALTEIDACMTEYKHI